jgi:hypothetical protein
MAGIATNGTVRGALSRAPFVAVLFAVAIDAQHPVRAQPYCAVYDNGSKSCGIQSLASCQQSVSGVGGICSPDETSQMRPDFFNPRRLFQPLQDGAPADQGGMSGGNLDQVPPPPNE